MSTIAPCINSTRGLPRGGEKTEGTCPSVGCVWGGCIGATLPLPPCFPINTGGDTKKKKKKRRSGDRKENKKSKRKKRKKKQKNKEKKK